MYPYHRSRLDPLYVPLVDSLIPWAFLSFSEPKIVGLPWVPCDRELHARPVYDLHSLPHRPSSNQHLRMLWDPSEHRRLQALLRELSSFPCPYGPWWPCCPLGDLLVVCRVLWAATQTCFSEAWRLRQPCLEVECMTA